MFSYRCCSFLQKILNEERRGQLIDNIVEHLGQCSDRDVIHRSVTIFAKVDDDFGHRLATLLQVEVRRND